MANFVHRLLPLLRVGVSVLGRLYRMERTTEIVMDFCDGLSIALSFSTTSRQPRMWRSRFWTRAKCLMKFSTERVHSVTTAERKLFEM